MATFDAAAVCRDAGVAHVGHGNWAGRAAGGSFSPVGLIVHHTAGSNSLGVVINGRKGVPGPLCNWMIDKQGTVHLISNGKANDSGMGSGRVLDEVRANKAPPDTAGRRGLSDTVNGNQWFVDIEVENRGDGRDPYPAAQMESTIRVAVAACRRMGWPASRVIGHKEWSRRKPDPHPVDMNWFRGEVARRLSGGAPANLEPTAMKKGDTGAGVLTWQRQLNDTQGAGLNANGVFDGPTEEATKRFQRKMGLTADGMVGARTIEAMGRVYKQMSGERQAREQAVVSTPGDFDRPLAKALGQQYGIAHVGTEESGAYEINWALPVGMAADLVKGRQGTTPLAGEGRESTAASVVEFAADVDPETMPRRGDPKADPAQAAQSPESAESDSEVDKPDESA